MIPERAVNYHSFDGCPRPEEERAANVTQGAAHDHRLGCQFHVKILKTHQAGFNQNYYTFAFILLIKIVLCSKCC